MGLLSAFARVRQSRLRALIDVGARSVAGGYAAYPPGETPRLCYGVRMPILAREGEALEAAMRRSLESVAGTLSREGAPAAFRAADSRNLDAPLVSIDAPWQTTAVRTELLEEDAPFTLTKKGAESFLARTRKAENVAGPGRKTEEHIVEVYLNGYLTHDPYGKRASRAAFLILTSSMDARLAEAVKGVVGRHFHRADARYVSGPSLRYYAVRAAFPHEHDMLIVDALEQGAPAISLVRADALVAIRESPPAGRGSDGADAQDALARLEAIKRALDELSADYPLPRTVLLLADDADLDALQRGLDAANLAPAWFSSNQPNVIPIGRGFGIPVRMAPDALPDTRLSLMASYAAAPPPSL